MLKDKSNDLMHLLTLIESLEKISLYTADANDAESFYALNDQLNFNAVLNLLAHVGETVKKLSSDLVVTFKNIDWEKIKGLRNRIAHDYLGLDALKIYKVCVQEVPQFVAQLYLIVKARVVDCTFDREELKAAKGSGYYKHVRFLELEV